MVLEGRWRTEPKTDFSRARTPRTGPGEGRARRRPPPTCRDPASRGRPADARWRARPDLETAIVRRDGARVTLARSPGRRRRIRSPTPETFPALAPTNTHRVVP